jgi:type II secretory pathway component GspD/PulD (secretin)
MQKDAISASAWPGEFNKQACRVSKFPSGGREVASLRVKAARSAMGAKRISTHFFEESPTMRTICFCARRARWAALSTSVLTLMLLATTAVAQDAKPEETKPPMVHETFYLHHAVQHEQSTEIQSVLRNEFSRARIIYVETQNAICMEGTADEIAEAQKIVTDLDRPIASWRLTYTLTETDNGQAQGAPQKVTVIVTQGSKTNLKMGTKVPLVTGSNGKDAEPSTQVQYIDTGLNLDAKIEGASDTPLLETQVEQSSVAGERSGIGAQDPLFHQTRLDVAVTLVEGKTVTIGTLVLPGSMRQEKVEVTAERVRE